MKFKSFKFSFYFYDKMRDEPFQDSKKNDTAKMLINYFLFIPTKTERFMFSDDVRVTLVWFAFCQ